jgi:hypothetical protein
MNSKKSKLVTVVGNVNLEKEGSLVHGPPEDRGDVRAVHTDPLATMSAKISITWKIIITTF